MSAKAATVAGLRWLAIIPCAVVAYVLSMIVINLLFGVLAIIPDSLAAPIGRLIAWAVSPAMFVYIGAQVCPMENKFPAVISLTVLHAMVIAFVAGWGNWSPESTYSKAEIVISCLVGIVSTIIVCVLSFEEAKREDTNA